MVRDPESSRTGHPRVDAALIRAEELEDHNGWLIGLVRAIKLWLGATNLAAGWAIATGRTGVAEVWPESWITGIVLAACGAALIVAAVGLFDRVRMVAAVGSAGCYATIAVSLSVGGAALAGILLYGAFAVGHGLMIYGWHVAPPGGRGTGQ